MTGRNGQKKLIGAVPRSSSDQAVHRGARAVAPLLFAAMD